MSSRAGFVLCGLLLALGCLQAMQTQLDAASGATFSEPEAIHSWRAVNDLAPLEWSSEGMVMEITGADPYAHSPAFDPQTGSPLWLEIRLWSSEGGEAQVFYFREHPTEEDSVRFAVPPGEWMTTRLPLPPLDPGTRIRLDPPGTKGKAKLAKLAFEPRPRIESPSWSSPSIPDFDSESLAIQAGPIEWKQSDEGWGAFEVQIAGRRMALGNAEAMIGYEVKSGGADEGAPAVEWLSLADAGQPAISKTSSPPGLEIQLILEDPHGATWTLKRRITPGESPGQLDITTQVVTTEDRSVVYLPLLTLMPGLGSFGDAKNQAVFAGLEYLSDEPSSSEADLEGPASQRQVPDTLKITWPLMAIQARDRYLGLTWEMEPHLAALFDSPDRQFGSGAHLMGLLYPGSDGTNRDESSLLPYGGRPLEAGTPIASQSTLLGGEGETVVPAIKEAVRLNGLPEMPEPVPPARDFFRLAAAGWLDSAIREGPRFRHAFWGERFGPQPAADAAVSMQRLARGVASPQLRARLEETAREAIELVPASQYSFSGVGHILKPVGALIHGAVEANRKTAADRARNLLGRFHRDGSVHYQKPEDGPDYSRTHDSPTAGGLTGKVVADLLENAIFAGDPDLIRKALRRLEGLSRFRGKVPRGAQTWEIPLHTPDILAAAHLVKAYTLGYELTRNTRWLEQARYWAWSGMPFVYLRNPTDQPIGRYNTIAVYGATQWQAPVWIGLPVQWCGLVYADALLRLSRWTDGPWEKVAHGIIAAGIQHTWPQSDPRRQGLLPDLFHLRSQSRDGPAINPGTLFSGALSYYQAAPLYDFRVLAESGAIVHAPGAIRTVTEEPKGLTLEIDGWPEKAYFVLLQKLPGTPEIRINGQPVSPDSSRVTRQDDGVILQVEDTPTIRLTW